MHHRPRKLSHAQRLAWRAGAKLGEYEIPVRRVEPRGPPLQPVDAPQAVSNATAAAYLFKGLAIFSVGVLVGGLIFRVRI